MCRYIRNFAGFLCLLLSCDLNFICPNGKSIFATAEVPFLFGPQKSVISDIKAHALFLTIHLNSNASRECLKSIGRIQKYVRQICSHNLCGRYNEILYGVGFGMDYLRKISHNFLLRGIENYEYRERSGKFGKLPKTGGDIFVHAKCNDHGMLFDLADSIIQNMPPGCMDKFEDIYGWIYHDRRDLSEFVDGTENPKRMDDRAEVAINKRTGGSYAVVQKWVHNMSLLYKAADGEKERWIGRTIKDSYELIRKPDTSHVARMVGSAEFKAKKKYRIVRQAQPYGTLSGGAGLLFIAYAADIDNFNFMLDRMTGHSGDKKNDNIMVFSRCVTGNYWYFPGLLEFNLLVRNLPRGIRL
ncbi:Dyp-type peroxidase, putative [Schistosoma mansoni]|nr:Dyp-type peroxidase, putative [Schistosoma mansoni]|eukprot:XP_018646659.1 Dyp-type peroxidase, putative [Schistosoma mansoni]